MGKPTREDNRRVFVVRAEFHESITSRLEDGAIETLKKGGVSEGELAVIRVQGSFELPFACHLAAKSGRCRGIVTVGCIVRGETEHHRYLSSTVMGELLKISRDHDVPITMGIITAENLEQAAARAGGKMGNRGSDAAEALLKLLNELGL